MITKRAVLASIGRWFANCLSDRAGSVLPMAAAGVIVMAALIGGGVDVSRAYQVKNRLQYACDAAVLAGRRAVSTNGFDATAKAQAQSYFDTDFDNTQQGASTSSFTPSTPDNGNTIVASATASLPTTVMAIFGYKTIPVSTTCTASMSVGNSDVVMVLDTTGSMDDYVSGTRKIDGLRAAMKNFYDTVAKATAGSNARVRFGFVPYSSSVNVGRLLNSSWLVDSYTIDSREPVTKTVQVDQFDHWADPVYSTNTGYGTITYGGWTSYSSTSYRKSSDCQSAQPSDTAWSNNGSTSTESNSIINSKGQKVDTTTTVQPQRAQVYSCFKSGGKYYVYTQYEYRDSYSYAIATSDAVNTTVTQTAFDHFAYKPVTYDVSGYKTFAAVTTPTADNGADQTSTWAGCIEERKTVASPSFSFSKLTGMSPSGANDLDIDLAPTSDDTTRWAPMWPEVAYYRTKWVSSYYGGYYAIADTNESLTGKKASSYCPQKAQLLASMNKTDFYAYADSLKAQGSTYHDLGMIWGARISSPDGIFASNVTESPGNGGSVARHIIFMTDGEMAPSYSIQSAYGIEYHDHRVTDDGSTDDTARHNSRFLAACAAAKAKGIRVWVIAFGTGLTTELETCASNGSAFAASDAAQLNTQFQEIAAQVGELRVVQ